MLKRENCMFNPPPLASFPFPTAFHRGACLPLYADACNVCTRIPASDTRAKTAERDAAADEHGRAHRSMDRAVGYAVWPREEIKADNVYSEGSPRRRIPAPMNNTGCIPRYSSVVFDTTTNRRYVTMEGGEKESLT